jgi:hypothetical protein
MAPKNRIPWQKASFSTPPAESILITTNSLGGSGASISLAIFIFSPNQVMYRDPDGKYLGIQAQYERNGNRSKVYLDPTVISAYISQGGMYLIFMIR